MKQPKLLLTLILSALLVLTLINACTKTETPNNTTSVPVLTTTSASSITQTSSQTGGNISADGGASITARGVCWSTSQSPTISNNKTSDGTGIGSFSSSITGLTANTTYYIRAYATNSAGTAYGNEISLTTLQIVGSPVLTTTTANNITQTTAQSGGVISADGGATVTARGICWNTSQNPTIANSKTSDGTGTGTFTSSLTGLTANTTYYLRAYATNSAGTAYGNEITLTTQQILSAPTLTTTTVSNISQTTAQSGGNITSDGGASVTARGVCWSVSQNPTTANSKTTDGTGTGNFTSAISGLTSNTTYYVRAYATNSTGTAYGNQVSFSTTSSGTIPTMSSVTLSNITVNSASASSNINSDGGATITAKGVCWSASSQSPTILDSKTVDGTGTASFSSAISNLSPNKVYYVRSYATNSAGTGYSFTYSFSTKGDGSFGTVTDIDGNVYNTITIGTQVWMVENLKVTRYRNGNTITNSTSSAASAFAGTWAAYNNDNTYINPYGRLYDWYAVNDSRGVCLVGWHVPTDIEWSILRGYPYLGGAYQSPPSAGSLKTAGTTYWLSPNTGATNQSGFSGLPGGRHDATSFSQITTFGNWWSSTGDAPPSASASTWQLSYNSSNLSNGTNNKNQHLSIRCIKD